MNEPQCEESATAVFKKLTSYTKGQHKALKLTHDFNQTQFIISIVNDNYTNTITTTH